MCLPKYWDYRDYRLVPPCPVYVVLGFLYARLALHLPSYVPSPNQCAGLHCSCILLWTLYPLSPLVDATLLETQKKVCLSMPGQEPAQVKASETVTPRVPGTSLCAPDDARPAHPKVLGQTLLSLSSFH